MALDRDLNVAFAHAAGPLGRGWEMMAATGVRGLRVAHESAALSALVLSDRGSLATRVLQGNVRRFAAPPLGVVRHDAQRPLARAAFDYVDLDPYGSPAPFVGAALEALRVPGVLAVTATDMRVLAGVERGVAERRYGGVPLRGRLAPEAGLRILLAHLLRHASEADLAIEPLLAYVRDHHVRAYVRVTDSRRPARANEPDPVAVIDPATWTGPRLPPGGPYGPLWTGPLFDPVTVGALRVPTTAHDGPHLTRMIERLRGEVVADRPFFYESNTLAREEHRDRPVSPDPLIEALRAHGWAAARTHARDGAFRTTAPRSEVVRMMDETPR